VRSCLALKYASFKVIVVSDTEVAVPSEVELVLTRAGRDTGPGEKRDLGMRVSEADFFAFIDDDAAPDVHWLSRAIEIFDDPTVGAVGGPGVTPPGSEWAERAGGAFYESWLGSGPYRFRFRPGRRRLVDDYPAYNFIIRRKAAEQVSGWGTGFYGGEDTVICLALVEAGWQIVYDPSVLVFHRRRPVLTKHLAQVGNVGRHRGYFVKAYPETSLRLSYFLPTVGTIALVLLAVLAVLNDVFRIVLALLVIVYAVGALIIARLEQSDWTIALAVPPLAAASHIVYGVQFVRGLLTRRLDR